MKRLSAIIALLVIVCAPSVLLAQYRTGGIELRGYMDIKEQAAPSLPTTAGFCRWYGDSTTHAPTWGCNGAAFYTVLTTNTGLQLTGGTLISASGTTLKIETTAADSSPLLKLKNDSREWQISVDGSSADSLKIRDNTAGVDRVTIDPSGRMGLGTATPNTVSPGASLTGNLLNVTSGSSVARVIADGNSSSTYEMIDNGFAFANQKWMQILWNDDLLTFRSLTDAGSARATAMTITGAGNVAMTGAALTAGTMTVTNNAVARSGVTRVDWTNAMVTALGASTAGDVSVITLPARVVVRNVWVVITGAGGTVTTLTVSVGRTAASYVDYIGAVDAKAAANTVYGDVAADRGTNLTGFDVPSWTGTTTVFARFTSTGGNLSTVTNSGGSIYIETATLP